MPTEMKAPHRDPQEIIDYWFSESSRAKWWNGGKDFDDEIRERYLQLHHQAKTGDLANWRATALGRLAEIIILDQFSRNMFRHSAEAFAQDEQARERVYKAVALGADLELAPQMRSFLYMPLMHSEALADHETAVQLYSSHPDLEFNLKFEMKHKAIIDRFGRYPHRNKTLGRESSAEELEFLLQPGSSF